jgi:hypothetical protein
VNGRPLEEIRDEELRQVRAALEEAVERRSLRHVARETGMSPSGLRGVLVGAAPYGKTWEKLRVWYAGSRPDPHRTLSPSTIAGLLRMLLRAVPEGERHAAIHRVLRAFEAAHAEAGAGEPAWLAEVRAMVDESAAEPPG